MPAKQGQNTNVPPQVYARAVGFEVYHGSFNVEPLSPQNVSALIGVRMFYTGWPLCPNRVKQESPLAPRGYKVGIMFLFQSCWKIRSGL